MTLLEVIGSALAVLLPIVGGIITYINRKNKKADKENKEREKREQEVNNGLAEGLKNRDGNLIARWRNRSRRMHK